MRIFSKIFGFIKSAIKKVAELMKGKSAKEVAENISAVAGLTVTTGIVLRTQLSRIYVKYLSWKVAREREATKVESYSALDYLEEKTRDKSFSEQYEEMKSNGKKSVLTAEEAAALADLAEERGNITFMSLSETEQLNILNLEHFDFKKYVEEWKIKRRKSHPFFWSKRLSKLGVNPDKHSPFREPQDYGFWNFILRPLDDFIHWVKKDPIPFFSS